MTPSRYAQATFLISCAKLSQLPDDQGWEVAFAGRSNAGKSSALNKICQQKQLAKTSKTPGRTQLINLFQVGPSHYLVDLPGYGYAQVPLATKLRWQQTLSDYLCQRQSLKGLILLMDIRHPLKPQDQQFIAWAAQATLPIHLVLTKSDKLSRQGQQKALMSLKQYVNLHSLQATYQVFSAKTGQGLDQIYQQLDSWLPEAPPL